MFRRRPRQCRHLTARDSHRLATGGAAATRAVTGSPPEAAMTFDSLRLFILAVVFIFIFPLLNDSPKITPRDILVAVQPGR